MTNNKQITTMLPRSNFTNLQQSKIIQMTNSTLQLIETILEQHQVLQDCITL